MHEELVAHLEVDLKSAEARAADALSELRRMKTEVRRCEIVVKRADAEVKQKKVGLLWVRSTVEEMRGRVQESLFVSPNGAAPFPFDGTTADKLIYAIARIGRFAKKSQIEEVIEAQQPQGSGHWYSNNLSAASRAGKIESIKFNDSFNFVFYGLGEWVEMTEEGKKIKNTHAPLASFLENADPETMEFK